MLTQPALPLGRRLLRQAERKRKQRLPFAKITGQGSSLSAPVTGPCAHRMPASLSPRAGDSVGQAASQLVAEARGTIEPACESFANAPHRHLSLPNQ